jgi:hypothetical protein
MLGVVALCAGLEGGARRQQSGPEARAGAEADLQHLVQQITTRHPNPYYLTPKAAFDREVADLAVRLPSLAPHAILVGFARIAALVGDGHTRVTIPAAGGVLPIEIEWLDDAWRVVRTTAAHQPMLGAKITRLDDLDVDAAYQRAVTRVPRHESEGFSRAFAARLLTNADVLDALGISTVRGRVLVTGATDAGEPRSAVIAAGPRPAPDEWVDPAPPPLARQRDLRQAAFAWRRMPGTSTAYVAFNSYQVDRSRGAFGDVVKRLFGEMDAAKIDRLVLDLRWNGGGDFTRGRQYVLAEIRKRDRWLKPGALYVLAGRRTFSAAMVNTVDLKLAAGAILVGEPTGARPNSYSETGFFSLPHTGVQGTVSICRYDIWPEDVPGVPPDRSIPPTWADYRDGRDAALEWILEQPAPDPKAAPFRTTATLTPPCRRR